ncbi:S-layer homology domain-containing protein [Leucobacter sp. HY1908]
MKALALLAGFAMFSSGLVMGAASPALADEPVAVEEPMAVTGELADQPVAQSALPCGNDSWWDFPEPIVTGRVQVGKTLSASHEPVVPAGATAVYQWYSTDVNANADMVPISGATGLTYKPTTADIGKWITFELRAFANNNCTRKTGLSVGPVRTDAAYKAPAKSPFGDVTTADKFYQPIAWMKKSNVSTGTAAGEYLPKDGVSREAMAAFMFRFQGATRYVGPTDSPFADVKPGDKFYDAIAWMYETGVSTGTKQAAGKPKYLPKDTVSREAMAAFIYRLEASKAKAPDKTPFKDVSAKDKFFKEIAWMSATGLSGGYKQPSGKPAYAPKERISREAMAAFLFRLEGK